MTPSTYPMNIRVSELEARLPRYLCRSGALVVPLLMFAGCVAEPPIPPNSAELSGSGREYSGSASHLPGPEITVEAIDGVRTHYAQPGWHKVTLEIARLDLDATPTVDINVQANRRYRFSVIERNYIEFQIAGWDVTGKPPVLIFVATATKSVYHSKVTYLAPPNYPQIHE